MSVAFSPDSRKLAILKNWDAGTGHDIHTIRHWDAITCVAISPDSRRIAEGVSAATLWDMATGEPILTLKECEGGMWILAFSPDGRSLAAIVGVEGDVMLWSTDEASVRRVHIAHQNTAKDALDRGEFSVALLHVTRAIEQGARDGEIWGVRAIALANTGQWRQAAPDYAKAIAIAVGDYATWYHRTLIRAGLGDADGYRQACTEALKRFGQSNDPETAMWITHGCIIAPGGLAEPVAAVDLAKKAMPKDVKLISFHHYWVLGGALYRAGQFEPALRQLELARKAVSDQSLAERDALFLAMVHQRLGHTDDAKKWLAQAVKWWEANRKKLPAGWSWNNVLKMELLLKEAQTLIEGKRPSGDS